jgi:exonuclease III
MSNQNRNRKILSWNVRGMNDNKKWPTIRNAIEESSCVAFCFQETKRSQIDSGFLKIVCPRRFNQFALFPSNGASGGLLTVWNGSQFSGVVVDSCSFAITVKMTSLMIGQEWYLTNVYGPCTANGKVNFTNWLYDYDSSALDLWLVMGDFNLIRCPENRNRPGDNVNEMLLFNDVISHLDLVEVPLKNRAFTWSNMQSNCLLEKLDWIFTSSSWTLTFPNTLAHAISHATSNHVPYVAQMDSIVPKSSIFRFENI